MAEKLHELAAAVNVSWDVPQSRVICGAHLINTVVQSVLKDSLKATGPEAGMDVLDEDALIDLAAASTNPIIKVSAHIFHLITVDSILIFACTFAASASHICFQAD